MFGASLVMGGPGGVFARDTGLSYDVVAHELGHYVTDAALRLPMTLEGTAVGEAVADVYAMGATGDDRIGEDITHGGIPLRVLSEPRINRFDFESIRKVDAAGSMDPHLLGEPIAHAAWLMSETLGIPETVQLWHTASRVHLRRRLDDAMGDRDRHPNSVAELRELVRIPVTHLLARATLDEAAARYGVDSEKFAVVDAAWKQIGVAPRWRTSGLSAVK